MKLNVCAQADAPSGVEPCRMGVWQAAQPRLAKPAELPVNVGKSGIAGLVCPTGEAVLTRPQLVFRGMGKCYPLPVLQINPMPLRFLH